jgi:hypothetical protein
MFPGSSDVGWLAKELILAIHRLAPAKKNKTKKDK